MGRLLRKKASNSKKKKKNPDGTPSLQAANTANVQKTDGLTGSFRETKRKPASSKASGVGRAAPRRLNIGWLDKSIQFLREVKMELKKVTWPSRKQTIGSTVVVITLVVIISAFLGLVDIGWSNIFRIVLQKG